MEKLIITVTCDSTMSYPRNPYNPKGLEALAEEYIRSVNAGAAICHLHGPYTVDEKIRADGTKLSDLDIPGWLRLKMLITDKVKPIIQYGIANGRFPQRVELMKQHPDMMSICFNAHDECFQPDPQYPPVELYGIHDREELENYCRLTQQYLIKPEVEAFHYGAIWNAQRMIQKGILDTPVWTTFFLGWPGGCWTPSTVKALQYMHDHKPDHFNYSVSDMDPPTHWQVLAQSILLGGHIRVGMEDSPYLDGKGTLARSNAELVEKAVRIAREVGREVATPEEARKIIGLKA
ncbi:MAG TPA: 3-keto-5-aminohexanoate cleavage protein [Candidatus Angelobacter sp.]|jgi:3-keto-5-aminohexanoate cleavage enzyme|nr:3-keto-5-aminohexanoate cleavage protein [Candidatus Angelobacter sp.]